MTETVYEKKRQYALARRGMFYLYNIADWYNSLLGKKISEIQGVEIQPENDPDEGFEEVPVVIELLDLKVFQKDEGYQALALVNTAIERVYGRRNCR